MDTPCIIGNGPKDPKEYARVYDSDIKRTVKAHRYYYRKAHGPIPAGHVVMHSCDNRKCINLSHLSLGTQGENMEDMYRKGRQGLRCMPTGEGHHATKLTAHQVLEILNAAAPGNYRELGRNYGVSRVTIRNIATGRTWSGVTGIGFKEMQTN